MKSKFLAKVKDALTRKPRTQRVAERLEASRGKGAKNLPGEPTVIGQLKDITDVNRAAEIIVTCARSRVISNYVLGVAIKYAVTELMCNTPDDSEYRDRWTKKETELLDAIEALLDKK